MKKFYSFLFAAVALVGFAACNSDSTEEPAPAQQVGKMEFTANIGEDTKTSLNGTKVQWCEEDVITINGEEFSIKSIDKDGTATFEGPVVDAPYKANYGGEILADNVAAETFAEGANIAVAYSEEGTNLSFKNLMSVLKFQVSADCETITFEATEIIKGKFSVDYEYATMMSRNSEEANKTMTLAIDGGFKAGTTYYTTILPGEYDLTISIDGYLSTTKTAKEGGLQPNTIYNLGELVKPELPKTTVYLVPGAWAGDNAHFAVFYWKGEKNTDLLLTKDSTKEGVYKAEISSDIDGLLFKRLDPTTHQVWNQTVDLTLPTEEGKNFFYFENWDNGEGKSTGKWDVDPFAPETPDQASDWAVAGTFNSWGDKAMVTTTVKNLFVAKSISFGAAYGEFKIKTKGEWTTSYGAGEVCYVNKNSNVAAFVGSNTNFAAVEAGTYDIYFDALSGSVYLMVAGTDYTTATKQTANGPMPDTSSMKWGLCGAHNSWGTPDIALEWDGTIGMYVAKSATLKGEFKVRADEAWTTSFGSGGTVTANKAAATTVYNNGGNSKATGTYDVYFWYDKDNIKANGKIWIKTPGSAAPTL